MPVHVVHRGGAQSTGLQRHHAIPDPVSNAGDGPELLWSHPETVILVVKDDPVFTLDGMEDLTERMKVPELLEIVGMDEF